MGGVGLSLEAVVDGQEARFPWDQLLALRGWSLATHVEIPRPGWLKQEGGSQ